MVLLLGKIEPAEVVWRPPMNQTTEPAAPESIPKYIREGVERQDASTLRQLAAWAEDLAEYREHRPIEVEDEEKLIEVNKEDDDAAGTKVVKKVPCGKDCSGCPHGPYEYRVHRDGKQLTWEYIGPAADE